MSRCSGEIVNPGQCDARQRPFRLRSSGARAAAQMEDHLGLLGKVTQTLSFCLIATSQA
jgi:hypothetical protein